MHTSRWRNLTLGLLLTALALVLALPAPIAGQPAALTPQVYLPIVCRPGPVDPQNRADALQFYLTEYLAPTSPANWTGQHSTCVAGATAPEFRQAVLRRLNYFRAMAGVPNTVTWRDEYSRKAQAAALMMSANGQLSHTPPTDWLCYTADGAQGAGNSNLYLGVYGWDAIAGYMRDPGSGNYFVGHRRWILYPNTQEMGTGDIPPADGHWAANALWVFDAHMWEPRPATRDGFVAWPPPGYVPYPVVFARWSFAYPGADFSGASVTMTSHGAGVAVSQSPVVNGYGENTLVWIPLGLSDGATWPRPAADTRYTVNVRQVVIAGQSRDFAYDVIIFDPAP